MKPCYAILALLFTSLFVLLGGCYLWMDGTEDTPEYRIRNLRIWKDTPAWELANAVRNQNTDQIKKLIESSPELLNYQEPRFGATLLTWAVGVEKYKSVETLLDCGADPNIATNAGETPLFVAAGYSWVDSQYKQDPKYVNILLKYNADPNICYKGGDPRNTATEPGTSPLMCSIPCGIQKTIALVEGGSEIDLKTESGKTAAIDALISGQIGSRQPNEYVYYLIVKKKAKIADPYYRSKALTTEYDDPDDAFFAVDLLRNWMPELDSEAYKQKMEVVSEFAWQGVDYWATKIPDRTLEIIQKLYPDTWEEYIRKY